MTVNVNLYVLFAKDVYYIFYVTKLHFIFPA